MASCLKDLFQLFSFFTFQSGITFSSVKGLNLGDVKFDCVGWFLVRNQTHA
jgi:hypothetical protein